MHTQKNKDELIQKDLSGLQSVASNTVSKPPSSTPKPPQVFPPSSVFALLHWHSYGPLLHFMAQ